MANLKGHFRGKFEKDYRGCPLDDSGYPISCLSCIYYNYRSEIIKDLCTNYNLYLPWYCFTKHYAFRKGE